MTKAYLITEYNGHMYPTKTYDSEEHRLEHALRHARVLEAAAGEKDIAGSFGWCLFDYNTHKDFGSGDRICYHGVLDMFRNPKLAAAVYASQGAEETVLEVSSTMDVGEHPASNRGRLFVFTNADSVRFYKNGCFIKEYTHADSPFKNLPQPPIEIDDFIGDRLAQGESFSPTQARLVKELLNYCARFGFSRLPAQQTAQAGILMGRYRMRFEDAYALYGKYIGSWGDEATLFRFEAVKNGAVTAVKEMKPVRAPKLRARPDHTNLCEEGSYDVCLVRLEMTDQSGNRLPFYQGVVQAETEGPIALIGPSLAVLRGGCGGVYVKTLGVSGEALLRLRTERGEETTLRFEIFAMDE